MKTRSSPSVATLLATLVAIVAATGALAQERYPAQPIKLVIPFPPGGATDVVARTVAEKVGGATGWTFVPDNRPGAGGNIGLDLVAKAKADGYTLGMGQTANLAINPSLYPKMPYDATRDFTPIALVAQQPQVIVVRADTPMKSLADLVAAAKAKNGQMTQALAGNGTVGHLAGEMFARRAGIRFSPIPYKGAAPALADLMGGQTDLMFATPQAALPLVKGGRLRALAVTSKARLAALADVPTVAESGYPGFEAIDWKVLVAPAGTPDAIVTLLNAEVAKALLRPDVLAKLQDDGSAPMSGSPRDVAAFIRGEHDRWGAVIRDAGIKLE